MKISKKNRLRLISTILVLLISTTSIAGICTDDYIISGDRTIALLPDLPFEILENDNRLFARRGTFILEFTKPEHIIHSAKKIKRYSLDFIDEKYYFDLITIDGSQEKHWEQYANEKSRRGFGGVCKTR